MASEMKVTNKKGVGFYYRAACSFFNGVEAKEAADGKEAVEAKAPVDALTISGLGEAIDVAVGVAAKVEEESIARISAIETGYPDMTSGRGCAQITIKMTRVEAPNLHKFMKLKLKLGKEMIKKVQEDSSANFCFDPEAAEAKAAGMKAKVAEMNSDFMERVGKDLLAKSFKVHDKDGNGVLDKDESSLFFSHFTGEIAEMLHGNVLEQITSQIMGMIPMFTMGKPSEEVEMGTKIIKSGVAELVNMLKVELSAILNEEYFAKKDERHAAALKCLDKNGDGKLQLTEFMNAFEGEGGYSAEFLAALGLNMEEHMPKLQPKMQETMQPMMDKLMAL